MKHKSLYKKFGTDIVSISKADETKFSDFVSSQLENSNLYWIAFVKDKCKLDSVINYIKANESFYSDCHELCIKFDEDALFAVIFSYRNSEPDCWKIENLNESEIYNVFPFVEKITYEIPYRKNGLFGWRFQLNQNASNGDIESLREFLIENYGIISNINRKNVIGRLAQ